MLNGLVHAAIYDAVVAVEGEYEPFAVSIRRSGPTSVDAAVAAAARGVLVVRVPGQAPIVETEYSAYLNGIPDGARKTNGIRLGRAIAGAYLALRSDDGYDNVVPWVQPTPGPGVFEPIPPGSTPVDVKLKQVRPLSFDDPSRFRPNGPNSLTSHRYTVDFNEVKSLGRVDSAMRTPEQTEIARFWSEQTMVQWNRALRNLALDEGLDTLETARMMAMAHVSAADSRSAAGRPSTTTPSGAPSTRSSGRHGREPRHDPGNNLEPSAQRQPPGVSVWALLLHLRGNQCAGGLLRHRPVPAHGRQHRDRDDPPLRPAQGREDGVTGARIYGGLHFRKSMEDGEQLGERTTRYVLRNNFHRTHGHDDDD